MNRGALPWAIPTGDLIRCATCRAYYHDDPDGRRAHRVVFGHSAADEQSRRDSRRDETRDTPRDQGDQ